MRTYNTLDLGTQRSSSATPTVGGRGVPGRWRLAALFGLTGLAGSLTSCVSDPDCGVCDPDNLILQSIAGVNYAGKLVKLLGPTCEGDNCPGEITEGEYFVEKVIPCVQTDDAIEAPRGADEWCKVSPLIVDSGIQFIFNNLLDPRSVELVRKQAVNPQLFEVFDWKTHIVHLEGPTTRFNGDYYPGATQSKPDLIERSTNLSCIENLAKLGIPYDHTTLDATPTVCDGTYEAEDGKVWPLKAIQQRRNAEGKLVPTTVDTYRGETDNRRQSQSCSPPQSGTDTCCDTCDYELSINVAKYGVTAPVPEGERSDAQRRTWRAEPSGDSAIACSPMGDKFVECKNFVPHVYRGGEIRHFEYDWDGSQDGQLESFRIPLQDKLREAHPDQRWAGHEQRTVPCDTSEDCTATTKSNLPGTECVGTLGDNGPACNNGSGDECINKRCVAEWFGDCRADAKTTGEGGYCVDKRWNGKGVSACFTNAGPLYVCAATETCAEEDFGNKGRTQGAGSRFSLADANTDGIVEAIEGCRASLGGGDKVACDPFYQDKIGTVERYDRKETLPTSTRNCVCEDEPAEGCQEFVDSLCRVDGDPTKPIIEEKKGQYAIKFVTRSGGVIYDPAVKGVLFLPADVGNVARSLVEACSDARDTGIEGLSIKDGWRANDSGGEFYENFDRAMCSSSDYKVIFNSEPDPGKGALEYIRDKVGNTLKGKSTYTLRTPDFHVVPGSGFPTDNLRIGACDDFELRFSNKYDLSEFNLKKVQIHEIAADGSFIQRVAGGVDCSTDPEQGIPCLTTNVRDQEIGSIRLAIDTALYGGDVLVAKRRYRVVVPGLELTGNQTVQDVIAENGDAYRNAFWDACGMPMVTSMPKLDAEGKLSGSGEAAAPDYFYDFNIDEPKPKEDKENDNVQFSCDNAPDHFNPEQADMDGDGFGDVWDLCPTIPGENNKADTDKDGIGNECDRCTKQVSKYNANADDAMAPVFMQVRNIPSQDDFDRDGIGDVCDNCIVRPNCGTFGPAADGLTPAIISSTVPFDDANLCQVDNDDLPYIGDACAPGGVLIDPLEGAAGPIGFGNTDDFDQDGIANLTDRCPRQRVTSAACQGDDECPAFAECTDGFCNHADIDGDGVGDLCDTCPEAANPKQAQDGGMQADDPDQDFVGSQCETNTACQDNRPDFRRIAFYTKSAGGQCCVQTFSESLGLTDPGYVVIDEDSGLCTVLDPVVPLTADCAEDQENVTCRRLSKSVLARPGVVDLPKSCNDEVGTPLTLDSPDIKGDEDKLYTFMCLMPQLDSDFDGVGDACDLCEFSFDPDNAFYKDDNNKVWPSFGNFCRGNYDPEKGIQTCADAPADTEGTGGGSEGTGGGSEG